MKSYEVLHAIRIKANAVLEHNIEHLLHRRVAYPSKKPELALREFLVSGEAVGFIVTNLKHHARKRDRSSATCWPRCCAHIAIVAHAAQDVRQQAANSPSIGEMSVD